MHCTLQTACSQQTYLDELVYTHLHFYYLCKVAIYDETAELGILLGLGLILSCSFDGGDGFTNSHLDIVKVVLMKPEHKVEVRGVVLVFCVFGYTVTLKLSDGEYLCINHDVEEYAKRKKTGVLLCQNLFRWRKSHDFFYTY